MSPFEETADELHRLERVRLVLASYLEVTGDDMDEIVAEVVEACRIPSQPAPTEGRGEPVVDVVMTRYGGHMNSVVRAAFRDSRERGLSTYGCLLTAWNGRNAALDAFEEQVDATLYHTQCHLETGRSIFAAWSARGVRQLNDAAALMRELGIPTSR